MKQSSKCAIGGIVAALSLVLMISVAVVPFLTYALPAVAGAMMVFAVMVPDKEVAVMYLAFFGYYPILKALIESKCPRVLEWALKLLSFLSTMVISYYLMIKFMGVTIDETETWGKWAIPILLAMGTFAFIIYDIALSKLVYIYNLKWRKHFKRYFK